MSGVLPQSATERRAASPSSCDSDIGEIDLYLDVPQRFLHPLTSSLASMKFYGRLYVPKPPKKRSDCVSKSKIIARTVFGSLFTSKELVPVASRRISSVCSPSISL